VKVLKKLVTGAMNLNMIKGMCDKHVAHIILHGENLKSFLVIQKWENSLLFQLLFNVVFEFLARPKIKKEINMTEIKINISNYP
jgi:hypothetical protein